MRFSLLLRLLALLLAPMLLLNEITEAATPRRTSRAAKTKKAKAQSTLQQKEEKKWLIPEDAVQTSQDVIFNQLMEEVKEGERGAEDVRINGAPLLWYAVDKNLPEAVDILLSKGADSSVYRNGESLIYRAALTGNKELLEKIHEASGIWIDARCQSGWKGAGGLMKRVAQGGNIECIDYVAEHINCQAMQSRNMMAVIDNAGMSGEAEVIEHMEKLGYPFRANEILLRAAVSGNVRVIQYLESRGARLDYVGTADYTPLMTAALSGNEACVSYILNKLKGKAVSFHQVSSDGDSVLSCAAAGGNPKVFSMLLGVAPDLKKNPAHVSRIIENAATSGNPAMLAQVITTCPCSAEHLTKALCAAARFGQADMVKMLIQQHGCSVNSTCEMRIQHERAFENITGKHSVMEIAQTSPFMAAIAGGNAELVSYMMNLGADLTLSVSEGGIKLTPLRAAARWGQPDIMASLLKSGMFTDMDPDALNQAVENGNLACARLLVQHGWDVNALDPETQLYPIQAACCRGTEAPGSESWNYDSGSMHAACLKFLIEKGATLEDDKIKRALLLALCGEPPLYECANILSPPGKDTGLSVDEMVRPLHLAAEQGEEKWVKRLTNGLQGKLESHGRNNPLFTASNQADATHGGHTKSQEHLRKHKAKITKKNHEYLMRN